VYHGHTFLQGLLYLVSPGMSAVAAGQRRGIAEKGYYLRGQQQESSGGQTST